MPPVNRYTARWLSNGKIIVKVGGCMHVLTWGEACKLAEAITEALQMERNNGDICI